MVLDGELILGLSCSVLPAREWDKRVVTAPAIPSPSVVLDEELILGLSCSVLPAEGRNGVL